jgi:hypothetical protein
MSESLAGIYAPLSRAPEKRPHDPHVDGTGPSLRDLEHELKPNLMVSADCEPTSASRIRRESSTMDCDHSKLNGTVFDIHDLHNYLRDQSAMYRKLFAQADDPLVKTELLALALVCEEIVDNIEDDLTGEEDHAPRGPSSRLS